MTFEEFLEKCRESNGWQLINASITITHGSTAGGKDQTYGKDMIRNQNGFCPLHAVFGWDYRKRAQIAGLPAIDIIAAADGADNEHREALLTLVQP